MHGSVCAVISSYVNAEPALAKMLQRLSTSCAVVVSSTLTPTVRESMRRKFSARFAGAFMHVFRCVVRTHGYGVEEGPFANAQSQALQARGELRSARSCARCAMRVRPSGP